ncbi:MAG TPA: dihydrofolate reductase family protein [Streptosporangiaceae bacterium]|nr:dihydrofolate reductase family protein [Streptosporangiaceae bacterium]
MTKVVADMSVSLDGFVADSADRVDMVFAWYGKPQPEHSPREPNGEAEAMGLGVIVYGRRTFDLARGWDGRHPTGVPVVVVTHQVPAGWPRPNSTVIFATDGIEAAMDQARQIAGDKVIALGSPSVIQQCVALGLVDRIQVKVVPVLLGDGIRLFDTLRVGPIQLADPEVTMGNGVTHLYYDIVPGDR